MGRRKGSLNKVTLESLPKGVTFLKDGRSNAFRVRHRKQSAECFATADEAVARKNELIALESALKRQPDGFAVLQATLLEIQDELREIRMAMAFRPEWIAGYVNLGRYIGRSDKKGRVAKAWAAEEGLKSKEINGVSHFSMADVDRAMRNGKQIETR